MAIPTPCEQKRAEYRSDDKWSRYLSIRRKQAVQWSKDRETQHILRSSVDKEGRSFEIQ